MPLFQKDHFSANVWAWTWTYIQIQKHTFCVFTVPFVYRCEYLCESLRMATKIFWERSKKWKPNKTHAHNGFEIPLMLSFPSVRSSTCFNFFRFKEKFAVCCSSRFHVTFPRKRKDEGKKLVLTFSMQKYSIKFACISTHTHTHTEKGNYKED